MAVAKQDKRIKKERKAKEQADAIVGEALEKAKRKAVKKVGLPEYPAEWDTERVEGCGDVEWLLAVSVRLLREEGEPWWAIAKALELEGAGDSATTGKKGAARARTAYAKGFGSHPRTFTKGVYKGKAETNERVRELKARKQAERKATAKAGKSVIDPKMSDEEVAGMLKGRKIRWFSNDFVPEGLDQEACVHPRATMFIYEENGERVVEFHEQHRKAPPGIREMPAHVRTVRLRNIYSVK